MFILGETNRRFTTGWLSDFTRWSGGRVGRVGFFRLGFVVFGVSDLGCDIIRISISVNPEEERKRVIENPRSDYVPSTKS